MAKITSGVRNKDLFTPNGPSPSFVFVDSVTSYVPHVCYPWPLDMLKRIRKIDPGFVPVLLRRIYRSQSHGLLTFLHHGVARYDRYALPDRRLEEATARPVHGFFSVFPWSTRPNVVDLWFVGPIIPGSIRSRFGLPAPYVPWTGWVEHMVRYSAWVREHKPPTERKAAIESQRESETGAEVRTVLADADYIDQQEANRRRELVDNITPLDARENEGKWSGQLKPEPKPFVHVKAKGAAA